jgi:hypothetical protein
MGDTTNLALILLAAFWSGTNSVFTGIKDTIASRDRIVTGKIGDEKLTSRDRWHIFWWDWAPLKFSLACISLVLCVVIFELPKLRGGYSKDESFATICVIASAMPAIGALYQLISFVADTVYLRTIIFDARKIEEAADQQKLSAAASDGPVKPL